MFPDTAPSDLQIVETFPHEVIDHPTVWIPLSDGTRLAARIWRPVDADQKPVPAVLEMIPYRRRDGRVADDERIHPFFAGHGFACARVDLRGSGDSEGLLMDEYLPQEQDDALEVIAWLAAQPWCSGAVGMMGLSWGGFNSLQVAARAPEALKAIIAIGATVDRYNDDVHYKNGCLLNENFGWATSFLSFQSRPPDPAVVGEGWRDLWLARLEALPCFAETWFAHRTRDTYWKHGSVCETYGAIRAPVMIVTGWGDLYVNAVPRLLENLTVPSRALAGPWAHHYPHLATPGPAADFLGVALDWWRHWLRDEADRPPSGPVYRAFLQDGGAPDPFAAAVPGRWIAADEWPVPDIEGQVLFLTDGGLGSEIAPAPERSFRSPLDCGVAGGELIPHCRGPEMPRDQRGDDGGALVFDTPPLAADLDIWGDPVLELTLSTDRADGNLVARLCDVGPEGASQRVTFGALKLSHRAANEAPRPISPGEPVAIRLSLDHVAHRFPAGHRVRLALSTASWPAIWPAAENPILTLAPRPARLVLPVRRPRPDDPSADPGPARAPKAADIRVLRAPRNDRRVVRDLAARTTTVEILDDYGELEIAAHGMVNAGVKREIYSIRWDDPLSARAEIHWTHELSRGDWRTRTETAARLEADAADYHLTTDLRAYEGDAQVFERNWRRSLSRR